MPRRTTAAAQRTHHNALIGRAVGWRRERDAQRDAVGQCRCAEHRRWEDGAGGLGFVAVRLDADCTLGRVSAHDHRANCRGEGERQAHCESCRTLVRLELGEARERELLGFVVQQRKDGHLIHGTLHSRGCGDGPSLFLLLVRNLCCLGLRDGDCCVSVQLETTHHCIRIRQREAQCRLDVAVDGIIQDGKAYRDEHNALGWHSLEVDVRGLDA